MKKRAIMLAGVLTLGSMSFAQKVQKDSLRIVNLQEVQVVSTRATATTPMAFTNINKEQISKQNLGVDIPYLLSLTPSAITTSDAGAGIGYTSLRIRGTDGTRINVTANGIPMNDAESHTVYWVNMPDFASSLKDMQIQRGAGTSTNGSGAFGGSINMQTEGISMKPYSEFSGSYGSFNTHKETVKFGTGLINNHWAFDARLSNIGTDGYIDRASVDLNSYFLQGGYFTDNTSVKFITFSGLEKTYHAWNYASKEEMKEFGRRYNSCGEYIDDNGNVAYYKDQTDNYHQTHYQLLLDHTFSPAWNLNAALHYTQGNGYYQEYKTDRSLEEYGLSAYMLNGVEITKSDLVRQKKMNNDFYGMVFSLNYNKNRLSASMGGGLNEYDGDHFGKVIWVKNYVGSLSPEQEYYRSNAKKIDGNIYAKANYDLGSGINIYGDLQYRYINYKINGANDNWDWNTGAMQNLDINDNFNFFNPKAGVNWQLNKNSRLYASFSVAQKEPTRNNYTDGKADQYPKAEKLFDYELGYNYANTWFSAGANFYYMNYKDQLVLTGQLNEIGEAMAANVPDSYRMGAELMAGIKLNKNFRWDANATLSRNRVKNFIETLYENEETNPIEIKHGDTPIAFSPDLIFNNIFTFDYKKLEVSLQSQYVSKQYLSNAKQDDQTLDAYFVSNLNLAYALQLPHVKSASIGITVYNLFNEEYENNGYAGSGYSGSNKERYNYSGYAAQAGTNVMTHLTLRF
ncbi:TonB-dependent receptor [uncultured Bacteroides sp.]|uniref:TonB-dependent receptor n=1 Tax=uncultured Bacteroides sp. TaxID=162156 RepID=UPI002AA6911C|nr:TonB-dependent receptor [uncultured Bacteroides sp.]